MYEHMYQRKQNTLPDRGQAPSLNWSDPQRSVRMKRKLSDTFKMQGKKKASKTKKPLLEIFVKVRTHKALDRAVARNKGYLDALKQQDRAFTILQEAGLNREQSLIVDRAISATNQCGAAYGTAAYRLGLHDGIRLSSELRKDS